jgi:hypothetical protein
MEGQQVRPIDWILGDTSAISDLEQGATRRGKLLASEDFQDIFESLRPTVLGHRVPADHELMLAPSGHNVLGAKRAREQLAHLTQDHVRGS